MNGSPPPAPSLDDPSKLEKLPSTFQAITDYFRRLGQTNPFILRNETFKRIEKTTGRSLICYVTKIHHVPAPVQRLIREISEAIRFTSRACANTMSRCRNRAARRLA